MQSAFIEVGKKKEKALTNFVLFAATVLIWGTTWIAIAFQIGDVALITSVFYRFALAGVVFVAALVALGKLKRPAKWRFVFIQAICLFSFNFIAFYNATALMPSGLVSVVFSLATIFNAIIARLFFLAITWRSEPCWRAPLELWV